MKLFRQISTSAVSLFTGIFAAVFGHSSVSYAPGPTGEVQTLDTTQVDDQRTFIMYNPDGTPVTIDRVDALSLITVTPTTFYNYVQVPTPDATTTLTAADYTYLSTGRTVANGVEAVNSLYILGSTQNVQAFQTWYGTLNRNTAPTALDAALFRIQTLTNQVSEMQQQLDLLQGGQ